GSACHTFTWCEEGENNESKIASSAAFGRMFGVRTYARRSRFRTRRILSRLLCCAAAATRGCIRATGARPGLLVGVRILLSGRRALSMALWLLGTAALCRCILGGPEILWWSLLSRILGRASRLLSALSWHGIRATRTAASGGLHAGGCPPARPALSQ